MRSHPGTGWFVALVVVILLLVAWPRVDEHVRASRRTHLWRPDAGEAVLRVPRGWFEARPAGLQGIAREPARPLAGLGTVTVEPDLSAGSDGWWLDGLEQALEHGPTVGQVDRVQRREIDGSPTLRIDWHGLPSGADQPLRGALVVCDRGAARVRVEFVSALEAWPGIERDVEAMLASLSFERR